ncbi:MULTISPECIES: TetR/AcrR family transcriptional regulator [Brevibacterium]|uniref:Transcriptional regulator, TetR family n=1 Tax=Brevibacterium aurantiacum TaxID=273384 RepID=A0A2H1IEJ6_BREAU|nr:TetR/AcrR family transcriptional regulator [Brevibacterium aurantiacum]SMX73639.1 transcriptional regulator, TetR family [Brevibacterium aurantiacum]
MPTPRGRPADRSRDVAIRKAALELLAEVGYEQLSMDAVATRARSGKNTIYRRWEGKADLIVDALNQAKGASEVPDHGCLRADLHAVADFAVHVEGLVGASAWIGVAAAMNRDEQLREVFQQRFLEPRTQAMRQVFDRAAARGEIEPGGSDLLVDTFSALTLLRSLVTGAALDAAYVRRVMDEVVLPLAGIQATERKNR